MSNCLTLFVVLAILHWPMDGKVKNSLKPSHNWGYSTAKRKILHVYSGHNETLYCGCKYKKTKKIDAKQCGYQPRNKGLRTERVEVEHIVPASRLGQGRDCWRGAHSKCFIRGRACCDKFGVDKIYRTMSTDLHNLAPVLGELNGDRKNYGFGIVPGEARKYGHCDFEVGGRVAEVDFRIRGNVARAYLYMGLIYGIEFSKEELKMYRRWHKEDPPDAWEKIRNERIASIQGNRNPFIGH
jgi:deoxyribonuclease-1